MTALNTPTSRITSQPLKQWTVEDYHRMAELGLLDSSQRTELLAGHITLMAAKGTPHVTALRLLASQLDALLVHQPVFVITQDPIQLDDRSEPEPDLVIVQGTVLDYATQHPRPEQVALVVEVADSSLSQDCEIKDKLYAQAGIVDYWVVDLPHGQIHLFRDPTPTGYTHHLILTPPDRVIPLAFPDCRLALAAILPPAT